MKTIKYVTLLFAFFACTQITLTSEKKADYSNFTKKPSKKASTPQGPRPLQHPLKFDTTSTRQWERTQKPTTWRRGASVETTPRSATWNAKNHKKTSTTKK